MEVSAFKRAYDRVRWSLSVDELSSWILFSADTAVLVSVNVDSIFLTVFVLTFFFVTVWIVKDSFAFSFTIQPWPYVFIAVIPVISALAWEIVIFIFSFIHVTIIPNSSASTVSVAIFEPALIHLRTICIFIQNPDSSSMLYICTTLHLPFIN